MSSPPSSDPNPPGALPADLLEDAINSPSSPSAAAAAAGATSSSTPDVEQEAGVSSSGGGGGSGEDGGAGGGAGQDLPMTMAASVILTSLPKDAKSALEGAGEVGVEKVTVRFRAVGSAPALRQPVAKVSSSSRFETVVRFLRRRLGVQDRESVFCYVNSVFAPGLDEGVGNLWRCFKVKDELVVAYSITPAFG